MRLPATLTFTVLLLTCIAPRESAASGLDPGFTHWHFRGESPEQQEAAFKFMEENGLKFIHGELPWRDTETEEGKYDFSKYDLTFTLMRKHKIKIYLTLGAGIDGSLDALPQFYGFTQSAKKMSRDRETGAISPAMRDTVTYTDKKLWEAEERWMRASVKWAEENFSDVVVAYGPNNEPWGWETLTDHVDYSEANRKSFIEWLGKRYGSAEKLNAAWSQQGVHTYSYSSFNEAQLPLAPKKGEELQKEAYGKLGCTPIAWADFQEFMKSFYQVEYLGSRLKAIKETAPSKPTLLKLPHAHDPKNIPFSFNIAGTHARFAALPYLDILGLDFYDNDPAYPIYLYPFYASLASRSGKSWGIFEMGFFPPSNARATGVAESVKFAATLGPQCLFVYKLAQFNPQEQQGYFRIDTKESLPEFEPVSEALRSVEGWRKGVPEPTAAVVWPEIYSYFERDLVSLTDAYKTLMDNGGPTTILYDYEIRNNPHVLDKFKAVFLPDAKIIRNNQNDTTVVSALSDFASRGGKVALIGEYDTLTRALEPVQKKVEISKALGIAPNEVAEKLPQISRDWELASFQLSGQNMKAFLGTNTLTVANSGKSEGQFEVRLPFAAKVKNGGVTSKVEQGRTVISGQLGAGKVTVIDFDKT